jgi:hypothetical protein
MPTITAGRPRNQMWWLLDLTKRLADLLLLPNILRGAVAEHPGSGLVPLGRRDHRKRDRPACVLRLHLQRHPGAGSHGW